MNKYFYWQQWEQPYRLIFWVLFMVFLLFSGAILVLQFLGPDYLIKWHVLSQQSSFPIDYTLFSTGPFSFSIAGYKTVITEIFSGGDLPSAMWFQYVLVSIIGLAIVLYLSLVTLLKRFWYLVAMGGILGFLILFHIETVGLFGWNDIITLTLVFFLLLTPSYYLHAFNSDSNFGFRVMVMALAVGVLTILIYFFSEIETPFTSLLSFGILAPFLLIILFIVAIAHEIVAAFVNVISATKGIANTVKMRHFLIITVIYLANILISYLKIAHYIDWELFYFNPYILLVISAVLGVWGSHLRASLFSGASERQSLWSILFMIIGIVSLATITYFMLSLNDPFIKVLGDIIIYSHLVIGVTFLLYVIYNFIPLIEKGYEIKKILYNPTNFPYFSYKLLSIIGIVALFAIGGFDYPVWYSMGGFNNVKADLVNSHDHPDAAEAYYSIANGFAYHNTKSNYSLGKMYQTKDILRATEYFSNPLDQRPTAQTVVNAANLQNAQQDYYSGLFTLQEGYKKLSQNDHLINNLAVQFDKLKLIDSANYYFELGGRRNHQVSNNYIAFSAKHSYHLADSLKMLKKLDRVGRANAAALGFVDELPKMKQANHMYDMVLLNNWLLSDNPQVLDSSIYLARNIIDSTSNLEYKEQLMYSWSLAAYQAGLKATAIQELLNLSFTSTNWSALAKQTVAKMYIQLGSYDQAIDILNEVNQGELMLDLVVALLENGNAEKTREFWFLAASSPDEFLAATASEIIATLFTENPKLDSDRKIYLYARYNRYYLDESDENQFLSRISDPQLKINLALDLASFYYEQDINSAANLMLKTIEGMKLSMDQARKYIILSALISKDNEFVQHQLNEFDSLFEFRDEEYLMEYTLNYKAGMSLDSLEYLQMAIDDPFFPEAILIGASFFDEDTDPFRSYQYVAEAVQANPGSPKLLKAYILKALDVGMSQFAENALYEYSQRFSGQSYLNLKAAYEARINEINKLSEMELND